jgi:hypothetical protein
MKRRIRWQLVILMSLLLLGNVGCSKSKTPDVSAATPQPTSIQTKEVALATHEETETGPDPCTLLTREDTQAVQGEAFKDTKASRKSAAGLNVSQCYFELPTAVNSVVLTVTQRGGGQDAREPKESWQEIFHREKASEKKEEGEEREPQKIEGVGDEAFWVGNRVGGALYVLKGNAYIRISVGGAGDQAQKTEKSKTLAQSVLKRLETVSK